MLSLDWAGGSAEAKSPYRRAGKLRNTVVAILENTVSQRQSLWTQGNIGLAKKFVQVYPTILQENPNIRHPCGASCQPAAGCESRGRRRGLQTVVGDALMYSLYLKS